MAPANPRTAMLHYSAPPVVGGVEAVIAAHAAVLAEAAYPVTVLAGRGEATALPPGSELLLVPLLDSQHPRVLQAGEALEQGRVPADFAALTAEIESALAPVLARFDAIVVHNVLTKHFNLPLTAALIRLLDAGAMGRCLAWCHDLTWTSPNSRSKVRPGYPWDLLRTYRADVQYVAVSELRQRELAGLLGCPESQVAVVYNGVDLAVLLGLAPETMHLAERLGLLDGELNLLLPVRVTQAKNIEYALRVVAALKALGRRPRLVVTGPPDPHDAQSMAYFQALLALRRELGVVDEARFVFESGPDPDRPLTIDVARVGELLRLADVMLMPSHREGFGLPVLEAGLAGVPVLAAHVPAAAEIGGADVTWLDLDLPPDAAARHVLAVVDGNPLSRLRRRVRQHYTWRALLRERIGPLLHGAAGGRDAPPRQG